LSENVGGPLNVAVGSSALLRQISGQENVAVGANAMQGNLTGSFNVAVGKDALIDNDSGGFNVAIGFNALTTNDIGNNNVAVGAFSGNQGNDNVSVGYNALQANQSDRNVGIGFDCMSNYPLNNPDNTALGYRALMNVHGSSNIGIGSGAGIGSIAINSDNNIYIANGGTDESGAIRMGTLGTHTSCFIQGIDGVGVSGVPVQVDANGQLGIVVSSIKYKENVKDLENTSKIYNLRPVSYTLINDETHQEKYGLIAEEVNEIYPNLVVRDKLGDISTIKYDSLIPFMLNELIKQNKTIEILNAKIEALQSKL